VDVKQSAIKQLMAGLEATDPVAWVGPDQAWRSFVERHGQMASFDVTRPDNDAERKPDVHA
jgi:hypothetical protein